MLQVILLYFYIKLMCYLCLEKPWWFSLVSFGMWCEQLYYCIYHILSTGSLIARLRSGDGIKWITSLMSCLPWSLPVSPWLGSLTSSLCCGRLSNTWKPSKVALNPPGNLNELNVSDIDSVRSKFLSTVFSAGTSSAFTDTTYKPSILPHDDLRHLLLRVGASSANPDKSHLIIYLYVY